MARYNTIAALTIAALAGGAHAQTGPVTISDGNATATFSESGQIGWTIEGNNQLFDQQFFFRRDDDNETPFERPVDAQNLQFIGNATTDTNPFVDDRNDSFSSLYTDGLGLEIETRFSIRGGEPGTGRGDLAEQIIIRNTSQQTISMTFFQYVNFNLGGDAFDDFGQLISGNTVQQSDEQFTVSETVVTPAPTAFDVASNDSISSMLNDQIVDELGMQDTFAGDVAWSFQWDIVLDAGDSFIITKDKSIVPAPGALALLGAAGGLFIPRRRR